MQGSALAQRQQLRAIPVQIQANAILGMNLIELQQFIETEAMENPALSVAESSRCPVCGFLTNDRACPVCGSSLQRTLGETASAITEHDLLDRAFASVESASTFDPFRTVASTVTLNDHLKQQARMALSGRHLRIAEYLIELLDDDGYFRESLFETADRFAAAVPEIESVLEVVQSFDPAGIGARDLRECLLIQLRSLPRPMGERVGERGECGAAASLAERMLVEFWDDLARAKHGAIAKRLGIEQSVVREAADFIRDHLTPRPASAYIAPFEETQARETAAVAPDIVIRRKACELVCEAVDRHELLLSVDETYDDIYQSMKLGDSVMSDEDCRHIREHVERAKSVLDAISLRKKTLIRVARYIVEYQTAYCEHGPSKLRPLKQKEVAQAIGVHESTVCRALAGKYCMLPSGEVVSFEVFFDAALPIRTRIAQIVAKSTEPLTDNDIAKRLATEGITIARRTVAKYRDQLRLLPYQLRAA